VIEATLSQWPPRQIGHHLHSAGDVAHASARAVSGFHRDAEDPARGERLHGVRGLHAVLPVFRALC
jgi:hypothetical protein